MNGRRGEITLGTEWVIDAVGCDADALRDLSRLEGFVDEVMRALDLTAAAPRLVHRFPGEGGATILVLLTESHLALHTFPEHGAMTVNVYCCRPRPPFAWKAALTRAFGAAECSLRVLARGTGT